MMFHDDFVTIHHGDAWELADTLDPQSIHAIVTSPPYWGLRNYGDPDQFGLEASPDEYVAKLVDLFARLRPALRDDGTVWLNLGDCYAGSWGAQSIGETDVREVRGNGGSVQESHGLDTGVVKEANQQDAVAVHDPDVPGVFATTERVPTDRIGGLSATQIAAHPKGQTHTGSLSRTPGLKPKDLVGIPWRVAFALQADGWYLRSDIIWHKPNPMPESVTDRPTKAHEYLFLLSKSPRYYYDHEAIKETGDPKQAEHNAKYARNYDNFERIASGQPGNVNNAGIHERSANVDGKRNKRSVWTITTKPFSAAHFAVFPPDLIEPCIKAGVPEGGTVLDPFMGSGTTAQVARKLGRKAIGFELNADYIDIAAKHRLAQGVLL